MCHRWAMTRSLQGCNWHVTLHAPGLLTVLHVTSPNTLIRQAVIKDVHLQGNTEWLKLQPNSSILISLKLKIWFSINILQSAVRTVVWRTHSWLLLSADWNFFLPFFHPQYWTLCELCNIHLISVSKSTGGQLFNNFPLMYYTDSSLWVIKVIKNAAMWCNMKGWEGSIPVHVWHFYLCQDSKCHYCPWGPISTSSRTWLVQTT